MAKPALKHSFSRRFDHPVQTIWPILADTARFNEAAQLPKHQIEEVPKADGAVDYFGTARVGPFRLRWQERPVNWITGKWFVHRRDFQTGPLRHMTARLDMTEVPGGCEARIEIEAAAANPLGQLILRTGFFKSAEKLYAQLFEDADRMARLAAPTGLSYRPPALSATAKSRLHGLVGDIEASGHGHGLAGRLGDLIATGQEVDLVHLRPLRLAKVWGVAPRKGIELCLEAARTGLLTLRWDLLCPRCRVPKTAVPSLDKLPSGAHCSSCNIDYDRDFARNVELSFAPDPAIRPISAGEYCLFGPMSTPHIKAQLTLRPGEEHALHDCLTPGAYRLRTLEPGPQADFEVTASEGAALVLEADRCEVTPDPANQARVVRNNSNRPLTAVIEERRWVKDALLAERVTSLQAFRDLFSDQVLRPGDEVAVQRICLLFSDLRGSTALFNRIGDAAAYHLVREHYAFLAKLVRQYDGAIVKTIGDAVMASFSEPADAVAAALTIQRRIAAFNRDHAPEDLMIKLGLHAGPSISVTLNDRLDYFGATVNMAARLQGESLGDDIVISDSLARDPAVAPLIAAERYRRESCQLRGFQDLVSFVRLLPKARTGDQTADPAETPSARMFGKTGVSGYSAVQYWAEDEGRTDDGQRRTSGMV